MNSENPPVSKTTRIPACYKTCWVWDLYKIIYKNNPKILKRLEAARQTFGIWAHLPDDVMDDLLHARFPLM